MNRVTYDTIIKAIKNADPIAISSILQHHQGQIINLSKNYVTDEQGNYYCVVDESKKSQLECMLIDMILKFEERSTI